MPTLAGFLAFIRTYMGINSTVLPDNSIYISAAFVSAQDIVDDGVLQLISQNKFNEATYNLAGHILMESAQDVTPLVVYLDGLAWFAYWRKQWSLNSFVPGIIASTSDEGTSSSLKNPDFTARLSMADLQYIKTPYGRVYFSIAQRLGQPFGIS